MKRNNHKWYSSSYLCAKNEVPVYFYCRFVAKWVIEHETKLNPVEVVTFFYPSPSGISWTSYLGLSPNVLTEHWDIHNLGNYVIILMYLESVLNAWGNEKRLMALKIKNVKKAVEYFWEGHALSLWSEVVGQQSGNYVLPQKKP